MTIFGSCGHELTDDDGEGVGLPAMIQESTKQGNRAVGYATVCRSCLAKYREWGILFDSEDEADAWLEADPQPPFEGY